MSQQDVYYTNQTGKECPRCHNYNCQLINESEYYGPKYGFGKGCCGYILFGGVGLLCGLCGSQSKQTSTAYWVCPNCNHKFKV